jgi:hypothetical protein
MAGRRPLQLVVANHMQNAGMEVVAPEGAASTLEPGAFYKLYFSLSILIIR